MTSSQYVEGWDAIDPCAATYYSRLSLASAVQMAKERCVEWSYADDAHGYCHERPVLLALVREVEQIARSGSDG